MLNRREKTRRRFLLINEIEFLQIRCISDKQNNNKQIDVLK